MRKNTLCDRTFFRPAFLLVLFVALVGFMTIPRYVGSASSNIKRDIKKDGNRVIQRDSRGNLSGLLATPPIFGSFSLFSPPPPPPPTVAIYAGDCETPQNTFNLAASQFSICAKVTGGQSNQVIIWSNPSFIQKQNTPLGTGDSHFTLTAASSLGDWRVILYEPLGGSVYAVQPFTVVDAANPTADIAVFKSAITDPVTAGSQAVFEVKVTNFGPSDATSVEVTDSTPANTGYSSFALISGPAGVNCAVLGSDVTCTIPTLAKGETATFSATYDVQGGTVISNTAAASSAVTDPDNDNNSSTANVAVTATTSEICTLDCPANVVVTANTTQGGQPGAFVSFAAASVTGNCGAVSNSPASGSFFTVGTHAILSSSEAGPSCSFSVTVLDTAAPTITCPSNITATAPTGQTEYTLPDGPGTPTINSSGTGTVTGVRSDDTPAVYDDQGNVVTPAVVHAVTDPYPVGTTGILWTVTDPGGRTASCSQTITILSTGDRDPITISCPANVNVSAPGGSCEAVVSAATIGTPTTNLPDQVTIEPVRSDGLSQADPFPAGTTQITWTATDNVNGNVASCVQTVTVTVPNSGDTTPPVLTVPANVFATTSSCTILLDDELGTASATDTGACNGSVTVTRTGVPPNFIFPTGTTTILYTATDAAGNTSTGLQLVTVTESVAIPPTITAPADVTAYTGPGATSCGTVVSNASLGVATANDNCPGVTVTRAGVPAGNVFPVGNTTVTYTATDASGNTATDTQIVTVIDNTPPTITAPADATANTGPGATSCGTLVSDASLGVATADDNCPGVTVTRTGVPAGNVFPVGNTTVTYTATDASGNTATDTQIVTVIDNTPPTISCPNSITLEPTCPSGAIAIYTTPVGADNCPGSTTNRTAGLASGSVFPIGTTTVTHRVTDAAGNSASCSFIVTVKTPQAVIQDLQALVSASSLTGTQKNGLLSKLSAALQGINNGQPNVACPKLSDFINSVQTLVSHGDLPAATGTAWISSANHIRNTIGCTNLGCS